MFPPIVRLNTLMGDLLRLFLQIRGRASEDGSQSGGKGFATFKVIGLVRCSDVAQVASIGSNPSLRLGGRQDGTASYRALLLRRSSISVRRVADRHACLPVPGLPVPVCRHASVNAIFCTATFRSTGDIGEFISTADSGNTMVRRFCPQCGTPLFSQAQSRTDIMVVRAGALDDPEPGRPSSFIWTASAPSWATMDEGQPNCEAQPPPVSVR